MREYGTRRNWRAGVGDLRAKKIYEAATRRDLLITDFRVSQQLFKFVTERRLAYDPGQSRAVPIWLITADTRPSQLKFSSVYSRMAL